MATSTKKALTPGESILQEIVLASQLDALQGALINLADLIKEGDLDLLLDQPKKSRKQKELYIEKIIATLSSPELQKVLRLQLQGDLEFFLGRNLSQLIKEVEKEAEKWRVIKMTVAREFEMADLKSMAELLTSRLGNPAVLAITIDRSLIGGAIIQLGNYLSDYSLGTRLTQFRTSWHKAALT